MRQINARASAVLDAPSTDVYATIADYHQGHSEIVPKKYFHDLQVEQGGYGKGTVTRFKMHVLGVEREFHHRVSEPEPGRILVEQGIASPLNEITTFTVDPLDGGRRSRVEISTVMNASTGLMGLIERIVVPIINKRIYRQELENLEAVARRRSSVLV